MPPNGNLKFLVDTQPLWWPRDFGFEQRQFFDVTALWAFECFGPGDQRRVSHSWGFGISTFKRRKGQTESRLIELCVYLDVGCIVSDARHLFGEICCQMAGYDEDISLRHSFTKAYLGLARMCGRQMWTKISGLH